METCKMFLPSVAFMRVFMVSRILLISAHRGDFLKFLQLYGIMTFFVESVRGSREKALSTTSLVTATEVRLECRPGILERSVRFVPKHLSVLFKFMLPHVWHTVLAQWFWHMDANYFWLPDKPLPNTPVHANRISFRGHVWGHDATGRYFRMNCFGSPAGYAVNAFLLCVMFPLQQSRGRGPNWTTPSSADRRKSPHPRSETYASAAARDVHTTNNPEWTPNNGSHFPKLVPKCIFQFPKTILFLNVF